MTIPAPDPGPIGRVAVGMRVIDSDGEQVGTVSAMKMGDPDAATVAGQQDRRGLVEGLIDTFVGAEPDVPRQRAEQLLRQGYIKIDAKGFLARDLYAGADEIHRVENTVRLSVPRRRLVPES
jgi:hypothetical protein